MLFLFDQIDNEDDAQSIKKNETGNFNSKRK